MPRTNLYVPILLVGMIITDMQCVENCDDPDVRRHVLYEQPVWQTLQMFLGEMLCFLPVIFSWVNSKRKSSVQLPPDSEVETEAQAKVVPAGRPLSGWKVLLLWIPAACDLTATTLMNIGLLYTPVSIYQMTRGSLVLFVAFLSVTFLRRRLWLYQWISLIIVMGGVALVGYSGSLIKDAVKEAANIVARLVNLDAELPPPGPSKQPEATQALIGVFFVLFAQVFTATQFVVEEKILGRYSVAPLVAVGFEGLFGAITILLFIPILAIPSISSKTPFFDLPRGWHQMVDTPTVLYSGIAIACSIALFNFFGLSVTRHVSATARSLADTCRTLSIWIVSLGLGWEKLLFPISLLQVLGFSLLVYGTFLFNNLVSVPPCLPGSSTPAEEDPEEAEALLSSSTIDETAVLPADLGQSGFDVVPEGQHAIAQPPKSTTRPHAD
ncbi:integral membrane protein [Moniliophthora roreri]|uniref:Integral membrane protein n=1 Tax=Moniliophthora roreri TaxID=221103 RepID=A0A0W0FTY9_MONRR|nr:integral membrane protein [Moniliophthora roreri]